jgi:hypothetical protein
MVTLFSVVLSPQIQHREDLSIALHVLPSEIVEKAATASNQLHHSPSGCVIASVLSEMFGQSGDSVCQQRDLDLSRASVCPMMASAIEDRHKVACGNLRD